MGMGTEDEYVCEKEREREREKKRERAGLTASGQLITGHFLQVRLTLPLDNSAQLQQISQIGFFWYMKQATILQDIASIVG